MLIGDEVTPSSRLSLITSRGTSEKYLTLAPGERRQLCDIEGPGSIVRLWMTMPLFGRRPKLRDLVLRIYWDGELEPSVECPLGDFFGAAFGRPHRLVSDCLVVAGGGYVCRFAMPFNARAMVEVENQSTRPLRYFFFQIEFRKHEQPIRDLQTFHALWSRENPTQPTKPFRVLAADGRGRFVGLKLDVQNLSWWLRTPLRHIVLPRGFGLGLLEGWETIRVDGESEPSLIGTGCEDYFGGGFYFKGGAFSTPVHGAIVRSYLLGRCSAYRFHVDDPIEFDRTLEVSFDHGLENQMAGDYCSVAYWYQAEPHAPYRTLPPASSRRATLPWLNPLQHLLLATVVASATVAIAWLIGAGIRAFAGG